VKKTVTVVDPDLEVRGGRGGGVVLLALPAFLPSVISSFFTQNKGRQAPKGPPLDPPLSSNIIDLSNLEKTEFKTFTDCQIKQSYRSSPILAMAVLGSFSSSCIEAHKHSIIGQACCPVTYTKCQQRFLPDLKGTALLQRTVFSRCHASHIVNELDSC